MERLWAIYSLMYFLESEQFGKLLSGSHNFTKKQSISKLRDAFCSSRQGLSHDMLRSKFWKGQKLSIRQKTMGHSLVYFSEKKNNYYYL